MDHEIPLICILAGQSDMVGRGEPEKLSEEFVSSIVNGGEGGYNIFLLYEIDFLGKEGPSSDSGGNFQPLSQTAQYSNAGQRYSFGPEWGIADAILRSTGAMDNRKDIYFIKFAAGSTNLHEDWAPGGKLFLRLVSLVRHGVNLIAKSICQKANLAKHTLEDDSDIESMQMGVANAQEMERSLLENHAAFFWLQGHSDASGRAIMRSSYGENFFRFSISLREEILENMKMKETEIPAEKKDEEKIEDACLVSEPNSLNLPIIASELDWLLDPNSKSSLRFAKRLKEINLALREACETLVTGTHQYHKKNDLKNTTNSLLSSISASFEGGTDPIPCIFANFPVGDNTFHLSYHSDGHCDNNGLLSLGRNMGRHFCESFLTEQNQKIRI